MTAFVFRTSPNKPVRPGHLSRIGRAAYHHMVQRLMSGPIEHDTEFQRFLELRRQRLAVKEENNVQSR